MLKCYLLIALIVFVLWYIYLLKDMINITRAFDRQLRNYKWEINIGIMIFCSLLWPVLALILIVIFITYYILND